MTRNEYLDQLVGKVSDLPTLPAIVLRVMQMTEDPLCSSADLARVILADPAMATRILKLANSAFYGFRQTINSVPQAISLLGFATLKNALLSAAVFDLFRLSASTGFDMPALWKHSVATATAAKLVAKRVRFPNSEKAFTAGLIHDAGKIVIARFLPRSLASVMEMVAREPIAMHDAEQRVLGLPHSAFGAWALARWGLPVSLVEAVEFHHHPTGSQFAFDLAALVSLANILAHRAGIGSGGDALPREPDPRLCEYFSMNHEAFAELQDTLQFQRLEIESFAAVAA